VVTAILAYLFSGLRNSSLDTVAQDFALKHGENGLHAGSARPLGVVKRVFFFVCHATICLRGP
jgi:hypothetical protein